MTKWYIRSAQGTKGPLEMEEIARFLQEGLIEPTADAYEQGESTWRPLREITALRRILGDQANKKSNPQKNQSPPPSPAPQAAPNPTNNREIISEQFQNYTLSVGKILDKLRSFLNNQQIDRVNQWSLNATNIAGWITLVVGFVAGLFAAATTQQFAPLLIGSGLLIGGVAALSTVPRISSAIQKILSAQRLRIHATEAIDSFGILLLAASVVSLFFGFSVALQGFSETLWFSLGLSFVLGLLGLLALSPSVLGIEPSNDAAPGEDAIALLLFLPRCLLRVLMVFVALGMLVTCALFSSAVWEVVAGSAIIGLLRFGSAVVLFMTITLAPLAAYLSYILLAFFLDIAKAILILPSKMKP